MVAIRPRGQARSRVATRKVLLSLALFVVAALVVGVGAYALFTDTQSVSQSIGSGTVNLQPINVNGVNNRLSVGATNVAAGDTIDRAVDLVSARVTRSAEAATVRVVTVPTPPVRADVPAGTPATIITSVLNGGLNEELNGDLHAELHANRPAVHS